ncbi:hypothetical protein V494_03965 [Pseudogymnoascus sp. VKM F-4513 (FW-928)]|nr:hypothetical protein V494_03965 [Pseudogymnoascus sp. VKM F-4513 (FW-928)]
MSYQPGHPSARQGGFIPLSNAASKETLRNNDAMNFEDIPMTKVKSNASSAWKQRDGQSVYNNNDGAATGSRLAPPGHGHHGRRKLKKMNSRQSNATNQQSVLTGMGKFYDKIVNFSIVTRYLVYVLPIAALIAIPIVVGATVAPDAKIGGIRLLWFFVWIECVWLSIWIAKLFAKTLPYCFVFLCGVISPGTRKYALILKRLEIPLSLVGWAVASIATFEALIRRPDNVPQHWTDVMKKILAAALIAACIYLVEKSIIQLISISYHQRSFDLRIQESKHQTHLLGLLYDASRALFPLYCPEFAEEDYLITGNVDTMRVGKKASGAQTPMRLMGNVNRIGDKITSAFGNVASEITGKKVFNPNSAHSIVVEALEKKKSSEALAKRLWMSFVIEGREALGIEDIQEVLGPAHKEEADEVFAYIDVDNNGDISLDEMIVKVVGMSRERKAIANSMHDIGDAISVLDSVLVAVAFVIIIFIFVAFLNASFVTTLATAGTTLLSLSFVFAVTCQEFLGSCIFLFIKHPYDVGDRVDINNQTLTVERISLLYTVFKRIDYMKMVQVPNIVLNTMWVENVTRSKAMKEQIELSISFDTSLEDIELLRSELEAFVRHPDNSRDFQEDVILECTGVGTMDKLVLKAEIRHKSNWANESIRASRRSKFMCALVLAVRKVPIYGPGGGGVGLGEAGNPSYSVAVSDEIAAEARAKAKEEKEAKRLVPTPKPDAGKEAEAAESGVLGGAHETAAAAAMNARRPTDTGVEIGQRGRGDTLDRARSSDIEDLRLDLLHRASTRGRRRADMTASPLQVGNSGASIGLTPSSPLRDRADEDEEAKVGGYGGYPASPGYPAQPPQQQGGGFPAQPQTQSGQTYPTQQQGPGGSYTQFPAGAAGQGGQMPPPPRKDGGNMLWSSPVLFRPQQGYFRCSGWVVMCASQPGISFVGKRREALAFRDYASFKATSVVPVELHLFWSIGNPSAVSVELHLYWSIGNPSTMADPLTAIGIVANIIQLVDFSTKVLERLNDFQSSLGEVPKVFRHIKVELPVLQETLKQTVDKINHGAIEDSTRAALLPAVQGCTNQIEELDSLLAKALPVAGDSRFTKTTKALWSIKQDSKVESITKTLRGYIATLTFYHAAMSSTLQPIKDEKLVEIRQWLSAPDPSANYQKAIKLRESDTGLWLLEGDIYSKWKMNSPSFIWLYGIPGCGKTILSSTVTQDILRYCAGDPGKVVAYFYFTFTDANKQKPELMVRSLISQLSEKCIKMPLALEALYSSSDKGNREPSLDALMDVLQHTLREFPQPYLILDALDECSDQDELMGILEQIAGWQVDEMRVLVTSRKELNIERSLEDIVDEECMICLQSQIVDKDIQTYVRQRLPDDKRLKKWQKDAGIRQEIETAMIEGSCGMFRWAVCQMDSLGECRSRSALRTALKALPTTLDETYERILCAISNKDSADAISILRWLAFSSRPLLVEELAAVVAINVERETAFDPGSVLEDPMDVLDICKSLVSVVMTKGPTLKKPNRPFKTTVILAHYSVQEYLVSPRICLSHAARYSLTPAVCHSYIAKGSIGYLLQFGKGFFDAFESAEHVQKDYTLAQYSAEYWITHAYNGEEDDIHLSYLTMEFLSTGDGAYLNWLRLYDIEQEGWGRTYFGRELDSCPDPLYYASLGGLANTACQIVQEGANVNAQGGEYGNALQAASSSGHDRIVELLLIKGADVNAQGGYHSNALQAASYSGHDGTVEVLLSKGANINAQGGLQGGFHGNALQAASDFGYDRIVEVLLSKGADVNAQGGHFSNAL